MGMGWTWVRVASGVDEWVVGILRRGEGAALYASYWTLVSFQNFREFHWSPPYRCKCKVLDI